jgi:RNA polymerase sigma factor (sigma-70 family)
MRGNLMDVSNMAKKSLESLLPHLRKFAAVHTARELSDGNLLERFVAGKDEAAFAILIERHAPMVLRVCRCALGNAHDAEDALQASFLILAQKAASVRKTASLSSWLHGVASRVAATLVRERLRRRRREQRSFSATVPDPAAEVSWREVWAALNEELGRLPGDLRDPLSLCYLDGRTRDEAARQLGLTVACLHGRLERGRKALCERLKRRGITLPAALLGAALAGDPLQAGPPATVILYTVRAAALLAGGRALDKGLVHPSVLSLVHEVLRNMQAAKLKLLAVMLLGLTLLGASAAVTAHAALMTANDVTEHSPEQEPLLKADAAAPLRFDAFDDPLPLGVLVRMGSLRLRQPAREVMFAMDGKTLISTGAEYRITKWDAGTGKYLQGRLIEGTQRFDRSATILSPDGKAVLVFSRQSLLVSEVPTGKKLGSVVLDAGEPFRAALAPGGKAVAASINEGRKHVLRIWDVATGTERQFLDDNRGAEAITFSPDGKLLAATGYEVLRVWDVATGKLQRSIRLRADAECLAFSPDSKSVAAGCDDGTVRIWDVGTGKEQAMLRSSLAYHNFCLAFAPDGKMLAAGGQNGFVLWDVAACKQLHQHPAGSVWSMAFAPDGKTLAVNCGCIQLWDMGTCTQLLVDLARAGHSMEVDSLAVSPDGRVLASACYGEGTLCLWSTTTGKLLHRMPGYKIACRHTCFSPDGELVASGGIDGFLHLWETATGKERRRFPIEELKPEGGWQFVDALALSSDGKQLVAVTRGSQSCQVNIWDTITGKLLKRRKVEDDGSSFTPNASGITARTPEGMAIHDTASGKELVRIAGALDLDRIKFSADSKLLAAVHRQEAAGGATVVSVAEAATGSEILRIETLRVHILAFSPDSRILATSDGDVVSLWEMATGKELFRQQRHGALPAAPPQAKVASIALLPGGRTMATGLQDGTILVWDLARETATAQDLVSLWADLAGDSAPKAYRAVHGLAAVPAKAVPYLKVHLRPIQEAEPQRVERLLADLDSDTFAVRQSAAKELFALGQRVEPALREALKAKPTEEVRRRIQQLLDRFVRELPAGESLRALRAVDVLERIATVEARRVLEELARGAPAARLTREAHASLLRLAKQKAIP